MEQMIRINLFGQSYTFRTDGDVSQAEKVAKILADEVGSVQQECMKTSAAIPDMTILILAALNIANRNFESEQHESEVLKHITERSAKLIRMLDVGSQISGSP